MLGDLDVGQGGIAGVEEEFFQPYFAHQRGASTDNCPVYTEPILRAWQLPYVVLNENHTAADLAATYKQSQGKNQAFAVLLAE